jgi:hypothetical protein
MSLSVSAFLQPSVPPVRSDMQGRALAVFIRGSAPFWCLLLVSAFVILKSLIPDHWEWSEL